MGGLEGTPVGRALERYLLGKQQLAKPLETVGAPPLEGALEAETVLPPLNLKLQNRLPQSTSSLDTVTQIFKIERRECVPWGFHELLSEPVGGHF